MTATTLIASMRGKLRELVSVDPRSLAVFRVGLGAVVIFDLIERTRSFVESYTDLGPLPRSLVLQMERYGWPFRLFALSGAPAVQAVLFVVTGLAALAMAAGLFTTFATFRPRWRGVGDL